MKPGAEPMARVWSTGMTYSWLSTVRTRRMAPTERGGDGAGGVAGRPAMRHVPVMPEEVLSDLALKPGGIAVDATLGLGGHALRMIDAIRPGGVLVGLDLDTEMLQTARDRIGKPDDIRVELHHQDFRDLRELLQRLGYRADGILFDLGLNTAQVLSPERGFSFLEEGPLDMRMDRSRGEPAAALLGKMTPAQIERVLRDYGDERWARAIAKRIVETRKQRPLKTTRDLVECVLAAIPPKARERRIHPATRTFQAIRILVNGELEGLDLALEDAAGCLAPSGTLAVLSYHSGEDRIVKTAFRKLAQTGFIELHRKPLEPGEEEVARNPRSRSAKLRSLRRTS